MPRTLSWLALVVLSPALVTCEDEPTDSNTNPTAEQTSDTSSSDNPDAPASPCEQFAATSSLCLTLDLREEAECGFIDGGQDAFEVAALSACEAERVADSGGHGRIVECNACVGQIETALDCDHDCDACELKSDEADAIYSELEDQDLVDCDEEEICCQATDPCDWADDDECDCDEQEWDENDCEDEETPD